MLIARTRPPPSSEASACALGKSESATTISSKSLVRARSRVTSDPIAPQPPRTMTRIFPSVGLSSLAPVVWIPVRLRFNFVIQMDVLRVAKGLQALRTQFATKAGHAHAAERPGIVVRQRIVDPKSTSLDCFGRAHRVLEIIG